MKQFILAAIAAVSIAAAANPASADTITLHGMWDTYKSGK